MSMGSGVTIVCDKCNYDCSEEKEFRGYKRFSSTKLQSILVENGWSLKEELVPWTSGVLTIVTKHYCPNCSK